MAVEDGAGAFEGGKAIEQEQTEKTEGMKEFILAQSTDLPNVPADILKWVLIILVAIAMIAALFYAAFKSGERPVRTKLQDDPPIEIRKSPKRYNHELAEQRYDEVTRRLDAHDVEIKEIQVSRAAALEKINTRFERVLLGLERIASRVGTSIPQEKKYEDD